MKTVVGHRNQGENTILRIISERNLSESGIVVKLQGVGTVGTVTGTLSGVPVNCNLTVNYLDAGEYVLEVWADETLIFPLPNQTYKLNLTSRFGGYEPSVFTSTFDLTFDTTF